MPSKAILVAAALLIWIVPARAFHTTFDYQVDRFEIDGNAFGASDGVPDLVDDSRRSTSSHRAARGGGSRDPAPGSPTVVRARTASVAW